MSAPRNVADLVRCAARRSPDKPALLSEAKQLSWRDLDQTVDRVAAGLLGRGLRAGDRVALVLGNSVEFVAAYFGVLRAGLVAVPVNPGYPAEEKRHQLEDSGAALAIGASAGAVASVEQVLGPPGEVEAGSGGEDLALLMYTSGTSGRPRGAMLSHRALLANLEQMSQVEPTVLGSEDVVLLALPLSHIYGLHGALGAVAFHGATGILLERFDPVETLAEIRKRRVTAVLGAPTMFLAWSALPDVDAAFAGVRVAVSGVAPLPEPVHRTLLAETGRHVFEGYGLTETASVVATTLVGRVAKPGSIGQPIPGVALRLVDEQGAEVEEGDPGQVLVRGANLFAGYWPDASGGPGADGWWATGDVAYADEDGDMFLVARVRELIVVSGFSVYPREVEDVLATHPDIAEVAVIGAPDPVTGEAVQALVQPRAGARLSAAEVISHAAHSLARFKCPVSVQFVDELPHSATGKVAKGRLREAAEGLGRPS
jgi:long-chain acyl-CoA synthetase